MKEEIGLNNRFEIWSCF